jgi:iron-sulfur cluster repair protein YtfE (RIC family)
MQMQQVAYEVIRKLSIHSIKEEEVLYPAVKKAFGDQEYKVRGEGSAS